MPSRDRLLRNNWQQHTKLAGGGDRSRHCSFCLHRRRLCHFTILVQPPPVCFSLSLSLSRPLARPSPRSGRSPSHPFALSPVRPLTHSPSHPFARSSVRPLAPLAHLPRSCSLARSPSHPLALFVHSPVRPLAPSSAHQFARSHLRPLERSSVFKKPCHCSVGTIQVDSGSVARRVCSLVLQFHLTRRTMYMVSDEVPVVPQSTTTPNELKITWSVTFSQPQDSLVS